MFIRTMLSNRRFKVELNGKQSRWRNQLNGLPQGSVLSPLLFNVYTNDQPLPVATNSLIYADDLCLTTQQKTFEQVETTLASGLNELSAYYKENHLHPNPAKTQLTAFHLKNRQADRKLNAPGTVRSLTIHTHVFTLASHSTAHSPTETTVWRRAQNSPPETTSWGSCMGRTGVRATTPWGRRRQHYVSPWPSIAVLSGPVPRIASSATQLWMRHAVS